MGSNGESAVESGSRKAGYRWFQFGVRDLLILVVAVAVTSSLGVMEGVDWPQAMLAGVSVFFVAGLLSQVRDLWAAYSGRTDLSADQGWGWRFAVFWRLSVACLFAGHYLLTTLIETGSLSLPVRAGQLLPSGDTRLNAAALDGLFCLLFVIVLTSVAHRPVKRKRTGWSRIVGFVGSAAAIIYCIIVWESSSDSMIACLVHCAIVSTELAEPIGIGGFGGSDPDAIGRLCVFCMCVLITTTLFFCSAGLTSTMARQWTHNLRRRRFWAGLQLAVLTALALSSYWIYTRGIPMISIPFAENTEFEPLRFWIPSLVLLLVFVTAASCRMTQVPQFSSASSARGWRRHRFAYYHEHPALLIILGATLIAGTIQFTSYLWPPSSDYMYIVWGLFCYGPGSLRMAILILAAHRIWSVCHQSTLTVSGGPPEMALGRFAATWVSLFVTAVCGIPILAWLGFSIWFSHWLYCPWP